MGPYHSFPTPPHTLTHASTCVGAVGVAMPYSMWIGCGYADVCGVYVWCIWENRVTEDSAGGGPCVRRAPPPALPC